MTGTGRFCVIGTPVEHSKSPELFARIFDENEFPGIYERLEIRTEEELRSFVGDLRSGKWTGCNVTMPWKSLIADMVDELSDSARLVGAVNTVVNNNGRLCATSTDGVGIEWALNEAGKTMRDSRLVILGAGGAARAALAEGIMEGSESIGVVSRHGVNRVMAEQIAQNARAGAVSFTDYSDVDGIRRNIAQADILINCTPLGMKPREDMLPIPEEINLHSGLVVLDAVYNPIETRFLMKAKEEGAICISGVEMLKGQALASAKFFGIIKE